MRFGSRRSPQFGISGDVVYQFGLQDSHDSSTWLTRDRPNDLLGEETALDRMLVDVRSSSTPRL